MLGLVRPSDRLLRAAVENVLENVLLGESVSRGSGGEDIQVPFVLHRDPGLGVGALDASVEGQPLVWARVSLRGWRTEVRGTASRSKTALRGGRGAGVPTSLLPLASGLHWIDVPILL